MAPAPGAHRSTFIARGRGGTATAEGTLRTLDPRETDPRRLRGTGEPTAGPVAAAADRQGELAGGAASEHGVGHSSWAPADGRYRLVTEAAVVPGGR